MTVNTQTKLVSTVFKLFVTFAIVGFLFAISSILTVFGLDGEYGLSDEYGEFSTVSFLLYSVLMLIAGVAQIGTIILGVIGAFIFPSKSKRMYAILAAASMIILMILPALLWTYTAEY